jgi:hypothetical protein
LPAATDESAALALATKAADDTRKTANVSVFDIMEVLSI